MKKEKGLADVKVVVLTGGPCGGKSSALPFVKEAGQQMGYNVVTVPEAATEFLSSGITHENVTTYGFQRDLLKYMLKKENQFIETAKKISGKTLIVCDRGCMDVKAYIDEKNFCKILKELNTSEQELFDRYDGVIHLRTVADGKPEFYTTENNSARLETAEEAIIKCGQTLDAWVGHSKLRVVGNRGTFENKLEDVLENVCSIIGYPKHLEIERKYKTEKPNFESLEKEFGAKKLCIKQDYLIKTPNLERRVRQIKFKGITSYTLTEKKKINNFEREEIETKISKEEYDAYLKFASPKFASIIKNRYCFVYKNQYFELDNYKAIKDFCTLEIELTNINQPVALPPFINVVQDVTANESYKNANIAKVLNKGKAKLNNKI